MLGNDEPDLDELATFFRNFLKLFVSRASSYLLSSSLESSSSCTIFKAMDFFFFALKSSQMHERNPSNLQPSRSHGPWLL